MSNNGECYSPDMKRLISELDEARRLLRMVEWDGYDTTGGERACPCCMAWAYQDAAPRQHGYACAIGAFLARTAEVGK